jgi:hypothetical protein
MQSVKTDLTFVREWIRTDFENTASWRRAKAVEWPGARNDTAAELLEALAATVPEIRAANLERLDKTFRSNPDVVSLDWNAHLRFVGFKTFPKSADEFVEEFLGLLRVKVERPTLSLA